MSRDAVQHLDQIIEKLVRDVEMAVHALYRGDVRQNTVKVRTETHRRVAREALLPLVGNGGARNASGTPAQATEPARLGEDEISAITRCITAWLSLGAPSSATPDSRCVPGGKEIIPTWGERERARQAALRLRG